jgi:hypothetical protein
MTLWQCMCHTQYRSPCGISTFKARATYEAVYGLMSPLPARVWAGLLWNGSLLLREQQRSNWRCSGQTCSLFQHAVFYYASAVSFSPEATFVSRQLTFSFIPQTCYRLPIYQTVRSGLYKLQVAVARCSYRIMLFQILNMLSFGFYNCVLPRSTMDVNKETKTRWES